MCEEQHASPCKSAWDSGSNGWTRETLLRLGPLRPPGAVVEHKSPGWERVAVMRGGDGRDTGAGMGVGVGVSMGLSMGTRTGTGVCSARPAMSRPRREDDAA